MSDTSLEEVIGEEAFATLLSSESEMFFRLARTLVHRGDAEWSRRDYFQLTTEADNLEAFLDDYGARDNRTFNVLRELVASVRSFALAGQSVTHLAGRLDSYWNSGQFGPDGPENGPGGSIETARTFVRGVVCNLLEAAREAASSNGAALPGQGFPEDQFDPERPRLRLPRNVGQEDLQDEEQRIAEVASKFLQASDMLAAISVQRIDDPREREDFLGRHCTEEQARVYEATVHNLQSFYDTYVKSTVLESQDARLPALRGYMSATLHLLQTVTHLRHFVERHEGGIRHDLVDRHIEKLVDKARVLGITLNHLLYWAARLMKDGRGLAEDLLPSYTNVQVLEAEISDGLVLHARPAALIVGICNRYGTPVEMEIEGHTCNAGSILELMVAVGSHPSARRFTFRGDENPLRDIALLFEHDLGENGMDSLPSSLSYLRNN